MFREMISPIFRSTRLRVTAPTMSPAGNIVGASYHKL